MFIDVIEMRDFYESPLGQVTKRMLRRQIREAWPDLTGQELVGLGYAIPYLRPFLDEASRVTAFMPASQGVIHWPRDGRNRVALADETNLPLPDLSVNRLIIVHAVEATERLRPMMREAWRVLAEDGRMLVIVPNRRGIWARLDRTPFGHGQPYTPGQIGRLLKETMFTPVSTRSALFVPPVHSRMWLAAAPAWERMGQRFFRQISGVNLVEAQKRIYAGTAVTEERPKRRVIIPLPTPTAARGRLERQGED